MQARNVVLWSELKIVDHQTTVEWEGINDILLKVRCSSPEIADMRLKITNLTPGPLSLVNSKAYQKLY